MKKYQLAGRFRDPLPGSIRAVMQYQYLSSALNLSAGFALPSPAAVGLAAVGSGVGLAMMNPALGSGIRAVGLQHTMVLAAAGSVLVTGAVRGAAPGRRDERQPASEAACGRLVGMELGGWVRDTAILLNLDTKKDSCIPKRHFV